MKRFTLWLAVCLVAFVAPLRTAPAPAAGFKTVREPAVAGLFYPRDPDVLSRTIDGYLATAKTTRRGTLKALICPHAGYPYSGPVAASGFRLLRGTHYGTVIILGPSHYALVEAASVSDADAYRTPLGDVAIAPEARQLGRARPFALEPRCTVERPAWAPQASRPLPAPGADRADTWEHADEVELPFLQKTLASFSVIPVVMGDVDPAEAASALGPFVTDDTLLVVSSDLSHYHTYAEAQRLDRSCVDAICALDTRKMESQEACGQIPILTLLHLAKERGWKPQLLDLRNSGDTSGDKSRVVGYAAIAFYAPATESALNATDRRFLLKLARDSVREAAASGGLPPLSPENLAPELKTPKGVFVTLTKHGELRGCIGHITARMPLYRAVAENARNATLEDPRFPRVKPAEVNQLEIEISVLTDPKSLAFSSPDDLLSKLNPHADGVVLRISAGVATYLPQVWEQIPEKVEFLDSLAEKAGGRAGDWRKPGTAIAIYHVESFRENER